jgi:DNA-binding MarR family transcriptional regulator
MSKPKVEENIGYWLILLSRSYRKRIQELLSEHGLFAGQDLLLMALLDRDGQTQSELAKRLQVQQATLTRMIKRVEASGLVERKSDEEDGRISRVFLTKAGMRMRRPIEAIWLAMEDDLFSSLTLEERLLLRRLLMQLHTEVQTE